jgi:hypothetical protein
MRQRKKVSLGTAFGHVDQNVLDLDSGLTNNWLSTSPIFRTIGRMVDDKVYWGDPSENVGNVRILDGFHRYERMLDTADYTWCYHDCLHHHHRTNTYVFYPTTNGSDSNIWYVPNNGNPAYLTSYSYPTAALLSNSGKYWQWVEDSTDRLYWSVFSDSIVPTEITIPRDPFDTSFSLWFLIVDLFTFKGTFKSIFGQGRNYGKKLHTMRQSLYDTGRNHMTASQLHDSNLALQFGLIPTVADMKTFLKLLLEWWKRYDQMQEEMRLHRRWRAEPFAYEKLKINGDIPLISHAPESDFSIIGELRTELDVRIHRTALYKFTAPPFQGWMSRAKQFVDAFGVFDPAALWDLVPFSFVVDWFINIGGWLHGNKPQLFPVGGLILDYCESIDQDYTIHWVTSYRAPVPNSTVGNTLVERQTIANTRVTQYVRRRFKPSSRHISIGRHKAPGSSPAPRDKSSFVNPGRVSISASLIAQRIPR